jgi:predicted nucleotidyltransferase
MDATGLEVLDRHHESRRLGSVALRVASLPAVVGLKLLAFRSRRPAITRDVGDVHTILRDAAVADERVAAEGFERLAAEDVGYGEIGAYLLGRDIGRMFSAQIVHAMVTLLDEVTTEESKLVADVLRSPHRSRRDLVIDRFAALRLGILDR